MDISDVGIAQMQKRAEALSLTVEGIVGDIYTYADIDSFDIVLLDSMVHLFLEGLS